VLSERETGGKKTSEIRYYFSSRKATAKEFAGWIRGHWLIESAPQAHKGTGYKLKLCA
jgi:predicted transposase YbfD/YdcC